MISPELKPRDQEWRFSGEGQLGEVPIASFGFPPDRIRDRILMLITSLVVMAEEEPNAIGFPGESQELRIWVESAPRQT
jgi:hypothetical protein